MSARDMALAALVSTIWGLGFAAGKLGLESFSPAQLTAARFLIVCVPVLFVPRPRLGRSSIVLIGATRFTGQFLFMFFAFDHGLPLDGGGDFTRAIVDASWRSLGAVVYLGVFGVTAYAAWGYLLQRYSTPLRRSRSSRRASACCRPR